jgi:hypothetical protein
VDIQEVDLATTTDDDQLLAVEHKVEAELVKLRYRPQVTMTFMRPGISAAPVKALFPSRARSGNQSS